MLLLLGIDEVTQCRGDEWTLRGESHPLSSRGVIDLEGVGMQQQAVGLIEVGSGGIHSVTQDGVARVPHVHTQLVRAACHWRQLHHRRGEPGVICAMAQHVNERF